MKEEGRPGCPLCQRLEDLAALADGEVVWHFPHSVALLGPWQFYHGYCVLLSRQHATELFDLDPTVRRGYLEEMCLLAQVIHTVFRAHKVNYELLGNQVPHLHWHLFPRSADDPEVLQPVWVALDQVEYDENQRQRLANGPQDRPTTSALLRRHLTLLSAPTA